MPSSAAQFHSGTHTLAVALFGLLRAGDTLLAATGRPYDTLEGVIGLDGKGKGTGTLMDYGVKYDEAPLKADFTPDYDLIAQKAPGAKVCHIQRSRGYLQPQCVRFGHHPEDRRHRPRRQPGDHRHGGQLLRRVHPDGRTLPGRCRPVVGSLIKNPGGGIAPTGGYIAGRADLVELCAYRLNAPGLGGSWAAPGCAPRSVPGLLLCARRRVRGAQDRPSTHSCLLELVVQDAHPALRADHNDIVTCFDAGTARGLVAVCRGVQAGSPVDSLRPRNPAPYRARR